MKPCDLSTQKFGKLTPIERAPNKNRTRWLCRCDCGNMTIINTRDIKDGRIKNCGCLYDGHPTRGRSGGREYNTWRAIIKRTTNPNQKDYASYGGRGIGVCDRWLKFCNFYEDMGPRPEGLTIERIDNDKGYYPENCKWETIRNQNRNKRNNVHITIDGITNILADWLRCASVHGSTFRLRKKRGLSDKEALGLK